MSKMQAYAMHRHGGPQQAGPIELPVPVPAAGEVLVQVHAVGLNPVDYKIREGKLRVITRYRMPCVMGNELAGVVVGNGAGAGRFAPGDRVFARVAKDRLGAFAEYCCVHEDLLARVPLTLDHLHAAAVPLAGLTALQGLRDELDVRSGTRLLITGGAGGVGSFAIPLAKWLGAHVTTTASPRGEALVRSLGADEVLDYRDDPIAERVAAFDAAFDLVGGQALSRSLAAVRRGGRVVSIAGVPEPRTARLDLRRGIGLQLLFGLISLGVRATARRHGVDYRYLFMHPGGGELAELARLIDAGTLPVTIDRRFAFGQMREAMAYLEQGHAKGKVVVEVRAPG